MSGPELVGFRGSHLCLSIGSGIAGVEAHVLHLSHQSPAFGLVGTPNKPLKSETSGNHILVISKPRGLGEATFKCFEEATGAHASHGG